VFKKLKNLLKGAPDLTLWDDTTVLLGFGEYILLTVWCICSLTYLSAALASSEKRRQNGAWVCIPFASIFADIYTPGTDAYNVLSFVFNYDMEALNNQ